MSNYELSILAGAVFLLFGVLALVGSMTNKSSFKFAVIFLLLGGGALYYAHISNFDDADLSVSLGLNISDIPEAMYKLIGNILN